MLGASAATIAQNVGIGSTTFTPATSSLLELRSTTSGFLVPRMTEAQKNAIASPTEGLLVYQNNNTKGFQYWSGTAWSGFGGDDLGNHIATQNVQLNDYWLSNDGGSEGIRIDDNGNVGIGSTAPSQQLQVQVNNNGLNFPLFLRNNNGTMTGGNGAGIAFNSEGGGNWIKAGIFHERTANFGVGKLHFLVNNSQTSSTASLADSRITILASGNVGIATTAPSKTLDVNGTARISSLGGGGTMMVVTDNSGNLSSQPIGGPWSDDGVNVYSTIGNIGIGTIGPTSELDVVGNVRVQGLSGSGSRMVVADASGNLMTQDPVDAVLSALDEVTKAVNGSSTQTTSSSSYSDLADMSLAVTSGRYIFQFNCDMQVDNGNTVGEFAFYVDGATVSQSIRKIKPGTNSPGIATLITVVDVASSGTLKVQFKRNAGSGTVTVGGRTLMMMKISS